MDGALKVYNMNEIEEVEIAEDAEIYDIIKDRI